MDGRTAFVLIDAQVNMFDPEHPVFESLRMVERLRSLLDRAREAQVPVVYVQHNGAPNDPDAPHAPGWFLHSSLAPLDTEPVVQKDTPNSFLRTTLQEVLERQGIKRLVIAGMQTEYCIDTTCRAAFALGYDVTLVSDAHSTYDTPYLSAEQVIAHHNQVLQTFASVVPSGKLRFTEDPGRKSGNSY